MKSGMRGALAAGLMLVAGTLGSCMGLGKQPAQSARAPAAAAAVPKAEVWQLRAGLNVAALTCKGKGRKSVSSDYRKLLSRHSALLEASYKMEQRRQGVAAFDRQQTKLYNRFANQRSPERFCAAASGIAQRAGAMNSPSFAAASPKLLSELERGRK